MGAVRWQWLGAVELFPEGSPAVARRFIAAQYAVADAGGKVGSGPGNVGQRWVGDHRDGLGIVQDVGGLVAAVGGVDGNGDGPQFRQPEPAVQVLDGVGHEQADSVAMLDAHFPEHRRSPQHTVAYLSIGVCGSADLDEGLVGVDVGNAVKDLPDGGVPGQRRFKFTQCLLCAHTHSPVWCLSGQPTTSVWGGQLRG